MGITPFPLPAHQTGRADFPHPASRPASPQSTRRGAKMDPTQSDHTEFPEHDPIGETPGAARRHLVAPDQEMTNSLVDRVVDGPVSRHSRPMVEVVRPAAQHAVQLIAHLGPGGMVAGTEHPADLRLEPGNAPLGRARPQVPVAILAKPMGNIYGNAQITLDREATRFRLPSSSDSVVPPCSTALDHRLRKAIWRHGHAHILFQIAFSGLIRAVKRVVVADSSVPGRFFRVIRHLCLPALLMLSTFNTSWCDADSKYRTSALRPASSL